MTPPRAMTDPAHGHLEGSDGHRIYYEVVGNPDGIPVLVVHGGPGAPPGDEIRDFFDLDRDRLVVFHQRGCGQSTPTGELGNNTTGHLLADMERLRLHLGIDRWLLYGGSWGTTLALVYAIRHPQRVSAMVLRGTFLCRQKDIDWLYRSGANQLFPDSWERFCVIVPEDERHDLIAAYRRLLEDDDEAVRSEAVRRWSAWEGSMVSIAADGNASGDFADPEYALAFAKLCCHYLGNRGFLEEDDYILARADSIAHIPTALLTGRYDAITPAMSAYELFAKLKSNPDSSFMIVSGASHSASDEAMRNALVQAISRFGVLLTRGGVEGGTGESQA